jgi:effector-binding domain-containing protein
MPYECKLEEQTAQPTLSIRQRVSSQELAQALGESYGTIARYLGELGEHPAGPPFAIYYNMDMENLDVESGFPVAEELPGRGEIQPGELPGGKVATCLYTGPYDGIETAYNTLGRFVEKNGYQPTGMSYELYISDPQTTPPDELQTQIVFPLKEQEAGVE